MFVIFISSCFLLSLQLCRLLFFHSADGSPETLVKNLKEDGRSIRTISTFLHAAEDLPTEDIKGGMLFDFNDVIVGHDNAHTSRFEPSNESMLMHDDNESSCSSSGEADTSSFLDTTTQPLRSDHACRKRTNVYNDDSNTSSDEEEIQEPL
jgi:hypothetical protein